MALPSSRQNTQVNPDKGIYVEMEGIMEVRYTSEDPDYDEPPEDMFSFQRRVTYIPDDFCHKNKQTTEQALFFCLVCNCDLKNLKPLRDHVTGNKHIRKACEKKRQVLGLPQEPQNAPRKKEIKKERPRIDVGKTLEQLLRDCGEPAIGLEYITEFTNPNYKKDHPMYTCSLEGCKSAWGTSDDIYHHVKNHKHQKNFFRKMYPDDSRISGMSKDQLLTKAAELEEEEIGDDERDYSLIKKVQDPEQYMELRNRPDDWSEKKAKLGLTGSNCNSNMTPLGNRKRKHSEVEQSLFDDEEWEGWQAPTASKVFKELEKNFSNGIKDIGEKVEDFKGKKGDEKYEEIVFYQESYKQLLSLFKKDEISQVEDWSEDLKNLSSNLVEKVEAEDRAMKEVSKLMSELEDEIKLYYSQRSTNKHKNIKQRMRELTSKNEKLKPTSSHNKDLKSKYSDRLAHLWKEFEDRSESVVEILEKGIDSTSSKPESQKTNSERNLEVRKGSIESYKKDMIKFVGDFIRTFKEKFQDNREMEYFASWYAEHKFLQPEVNAFTKKIQKGIVKSWIYFTLTPETKNSVNKYLVQKMDKYRMGEIYQRKK